MLRSTSDTTTTSPTAISPFSSYSVRSEATSDAMATELPDLGAFTTVFRALNNLQAPRAFSIPPGAGATAAEHDSDVSAEPTVWSHTPVASYLARDPELSENSQESRSPSPSASGGSASGSGSDTEGEADAQTVEIEEISDVDEGDQPSLGYLDEALSFIAAERARYAALREAGAKGSGATLGHGVERRRKRRQRRAKTLLQGEPLDGAGRVTTVAAVDATAEEDDSSSSFERSHSSRFQSTPATPRRRKKEKEERSLVEENSKLSHSKSTPSLRLSLVMPPSPRVLQLRSLAHKLRLLFPADESALTAILSNDFVDRDNFVDPRGPVPRSQDTLIHVFIDHSNILIGLLTYVKRHVRAARQKSKRLSHAALALILERGRPITRRVLVTSSPLYQPMDSAEQLGYEVRVYARVPYTGDGQDRRVGNVGGASSGNSGESVGGHWRKFTPSKGHARKTSGSTSTESEPGAGVSGFPQAFARSIGGPSRVRYREQGVDELLQLKLHQAIADVDVPPANATIVLATGDGNVGQFSEEGFLGPVRTALKKGWRVELYCWVSGMSKAWMREFGEGAYRERFKVIEMEQFGADMLEAEI